MNLEHHVDILHELCRLCGGRVVQAKDPAPPKQCRDYIQRIKESYNIDCSEEDSEVYPIYFCHLCYSKTFKLKVQTATEWLPHPRTGTCKVCLTYESQKKGGRPKKHKAPGRKRKYLTTEDHLRMIQVEAITLHHDGEKFEVNSRDFICTICSNLINDGLETKCGHLFCKECLIDKFKANTKIKCEICGTQVSHEAIFAPKSYFKMAFDNQQTSCKRCKDIVLLKDQENHTCRQNEIEEMLTRPLTEPLTKSMERLGSHIMKSKLTQSHDKRSVSFKTGGQVSLIFRSICIQV